MICITKPTRAHEIMFSRSFYQCIFPQDKIFLVNAMWSLTKVMCGPLHETTKQSTLWCQSGTCVNAAGIADISAAHNRSWGAQSQEVWDRIALMKSRAYAEIVDRVDVLYSSLINDQVGPRVVWLVYHSFLRGWWIPHMLFMLILCDCVLIMGTLLGPKRLADHYWRCSRRKPALQRSEF